jgi:uncharacterized protein
MTLFNDGWITALWGGVLIGISASLMLYLNGRVAGISGILNGLLIARKGDRGWRASFIGGLLAGGFTLNLLRPQSFATLETGSNWTIFFAGLLVGFGTVLGSGCTSGHGVCGVSRMSTRSIVATGVFMAAGFVAVFLYKKLGWL